MSDRPMKWYIFNENKQPLCWKEKAVEFSSKEAAERFLRSHTDAMDISYEEYCDIVGISIKECIFYYDGGYIDCSDKIVFYEDDDCEGELKNVEEIN